MTVLPAAEVRGITRAYYAVRDLLDASHPLPSDTAAAFEAFLRSTEERLAAVTEGARPSRWAREHIGPVLAAALGAAVFMRRDTPTAVSALRVLGLSGEKPLSNQDAWKLVHPVAMDAIVSQSDLAEISRKSGMRLSRIQAAPTPAAVLAELTRPRSGEFSARVGRWIATYFIDHPLSPSPYADAYRKSLAELTALNERRELAAPEVHDRMNEEDWARVIHGMVPDSGLRIRAAYVVTRQFIQDYWQQWNWKRSTSSGQ